MCEPRLRNSTTHERRSHKDPSCGPRPRNPPPHERRSRNSTTPESFTQRLELQITSGNFTRHTSGVRAKTRDAGRAWGIFTHTHTHTHTHTWEMFAQRLELRAMPWEFHHTRESFTQQLEPRAAHGSFVRTRQVSLNSAAGRVFARMGCRVRRNFISISCVCGAFSRARPTARVFVRTFLVRGRIPQAAGHARRTAPRTGDARGIPPHNDPNCRPRLLASPEELSKHGSRSHKDSGREPRLRNPTAYAQAFTRFHHTHMLFMRTLGPWAAPTNPATTADAHGISQHA
jgi:hypothetical protein